MYNPEYTRRFYNAYGEHEWNRLSDNAYGRLQAVIHIDFLKRYVHQGDAVLEAGSGPGRFTMELARLGAKVTVLDLSERQLELARAKVSAAGPLDQVQGFIQGDITDLAFPENTFDVTVAYGGAMSYVCEHRHRAASELVRVTRPEGILLISVMSRYGASASMGRDPLLPGLENPEEIHLWRAVETGDLSGFLSTKGEDMNHPPMHLDSASELQESLPECEALEIAGSNVSVTRRHEWLDTWVQDPSHWGTIVRLERSLNHVPGLLDSGTHMIMAARRRKA
jgi:SAM-dependent methyltransferase